jgi:hypothetical protein
MSFTCWQALGSPTLAASQTVLKAFDGHVFSPHGILTAFPIELGGKTVTVEVEVVNAPLDYNLLLGFSWFYPMRVVASTVYRLVHFPHLGRIVSINQLDYCSPNVRFDAAAHVPLVHSHAVPELIGAGLFKDPCLMGVFPLPVPDTFVAPINMISSVGTFMGDTWILPHPIEVEKYGDTMPLSPAKKTYSVIQSEFVSNICPPTEGELDPYSLPEWADIAFSSLHDFLNDVLLSDKVIIEAMVLSERPWEDNHHRSSILPPLNEEDSSLTSTATEDGPTRPPSTSSHLSTEGNLSNISKTITIDISVKPGTVEAITIRANSTQQEIVSLKDLRRKHQKYSKTTQIPTKSFSTVSSTE